jgi:hypothetical protein
MHCEVTTMILIILSLVILDPTIAFAIPLVVLMTSTTNDVIKIYVRPYLCNNWGERYATGDCSIYIIFNVLHYVVPTWRMLEFVRWDNDDAITYSQCAQVVTSSHCYHSKLGYRFSFCYQCCMCALKTSLPIITLSKLTSVRNDAVTQEWLDRISWNLAWFFFFANGA